MSFLDFHGPILDFGWKTSSFPSPPSARKGLELPKEGKFPFRETNFGVAVKKAKEAAALRFRSQKNLEKRSKIHGESNMTPPLMGGNVGNIQLNIHLDGSRYQVSMCIHRYTSTQYHKSEQFC